MSEAIKRPDGWASTVLSFVDSIQRGAYRLVVALCEYNEIALPSGEGKPDAQYTAVVSAVYADCKGAGYTGSRDAFVKAVQRGREAANKPSSDSKSGSGRTTRTVSEIIAEWSAKKRESYFAALSEYRDKHNGFGA